MAEIAPATQFALPDPGVSQLPGGDVTISERRGLGIATVQARRGQETALRDCVRRGLMLKLPDRPAIAHAGGVSAVGIGPHHWLALSKDGHAFSRSLRAIVTPFASVSDQSGGYVVFRIDGRASRKTLAKGFPIDLDSRAFRVGDAATTIVAHIGATIWRCEDHADGSACFEIILFRSLSRSFLEWFASSAAEFGSDCQPPTRR